MVHFFGEGEKVTLYPATRNLYSTETRLNISPYFPFHISVVTLMHAYPAHRHDFLEMSFVVEGEGCQVINGTTYPMAPGTCTFLLPFQIHEIVPESSRPLRLINCMFDSDFLFLSTGAGTRLKDLLFAKEEWPPFVQFGGSQREVVEAILHGMLTEFGEDELWRDDLLRFKLSELLIRFDRLRRKGTTGQRPAKASPTKSVWSAIRYIQAYYQEQLTLSDVAEAFEMNSSYLSAEFKRHTGLNFVRFLHEVRIRHACSLLACTDMSVFDVAIEVGFGSYPSFRRIFHELKGIAPGEYRKRSQDITVAT